MVGRDKERDKLEFQVMKAIDGEGSVVNVIGRLALQALTPPARETS